jgi:Peptidase family M28
MSKRKTGLKIVLWIVGLLVVCVLGLIAFVVNPVVSFGVGERAVKENASPATLEKHVRALVEISPKRNNANIPSLDRAADYIREHLRAAGLETEDQVFRADDGEYRNVRARIKGREPGLVVIGAHYDVCEETPGADDNASAVAGLLEIVRLIKSSGKIPRRSLELVAWTLEEPPHFRQNTMGSFVHAQSLVAQGVQPDLAISLEMLGYFSDMEGSQTFHLWPLTVLYPSVGNFIAIAGSAREWLQVRRMKTLFRRATDLPLRTLNTPIRFWGIDFSDHLNYWKHGIPAVMLTDTAFLRNKNYHEPTDTPETLDFVRMAAVVDGMAEVALEF